MFGHSLTVPMILYGFAGQQLPGLQCGAILSQSTQSFARYRRGAIKNGLNLKTTRNGKIATTARGGKTQFNPVSGVYGMALPQCSWFFVNS